MVSLLKNISEIMNYSIYIYIIVSFVLYRRYILIAHPLWYEKVYRPFHIALMLLSTWGFGFGIMVPPLIGAWGRFGIDSQTFACNVVKEGGSTPKKFFYLLGFLLPCVVMVMAYSCIYWRVRRSRTKLLVHR